MNKIILTTLLFSAINVFSQASKGKFIKDNTTGCMVWSDDYSPKDSIAWKGACKNNYADGYGTLNWYTDNKVVATYTGIMKVGKPNGKGKYVFINYAVYEGTFTDGALNGKGAAYFSNGGKTIGNFVKGDFLNLDDKYMPLLKKQYVPIKDTGGIYGNDNDADKLFYYALIPKGKIKAALVLFPSTGETAENVISCNKVLMQQAYDNNILPVVLSVNYNKGLEIDAFAVHFFETVFKELVTKFNAPEDKFILSGLSLGGENVLQYTEMSRNENYQTSIKPLAVIGVDPPVDLVDLYYGAKNEIAKYEAIGKTINESRSAALKEDYFLLDYFHKDYGGSPEEFPQNYINGSQFSRNREDGGNAKYLINVPVRLYCDPDILWQMKNKSRDYYSMNAANLSAMINFLQLKGNTRAALIPALGKGYRVDGTRHPHSWSIVEPYDCIKWILKLIK